MGLAVGAYVPLNYYAREGDCFSQTVSRADMLINWHKAFDGVN
mgnify:CR=1 FL=1